MLIWIKWWGAVPTSSKNLTLEWLVLFHLHFFEFLGNWSRFNSLTFLVFAWIWWCHVGAILERGGLISLSVNPCVSICSIWEVYSRNLSYLVKLWAVDLIEVRTRARSTFKTLGTKVSSLYCTQKSSLVELRPTVNCVKSIVPLMLNRSWALESILNFGIIWRLSIIVMSRSKIIIDLTSCHV